MKMAAGGWRPADNVQLATDVESRVIVSVTKKGNDQGQIAPMLAEIGRRTERLPQELLADGGYRCLAAIEEAEASGVQICAPLTRPRTNGKDPSKSKESDGPGVSAWRLRMRKQRSKEIYEDRAATAERTNADLRCHRGSNASRCAGSKRSCAWHCGRRSPST